MILDPDQFKLSDLHRYQRFNIVGTSGSGKSTLGRDLAELVQAPYIEMDQLFWKPNWTEPTDTEFFNKLDAAIAGDQWVLDGNYTRTMPIKWRRTQLVIWLDLPFAKTVARVTKRAIKRSLFGFELWPETGNVETFRRSFFSRESIIWWAVRHHASNRKKYQRIMASGDYPSLDFLRLTSTRQVEQLVPRQHSLPLSR